MRRTIWRESQDRTLTEDNSGYFVGSKTRDGLHAPVLDLDFGAQLVPSSTPGHFHLYIDKEIPWAAYERVLRAMADAGLISETYYRMSCEAGMTMVIRPGLTKAEVRRTSNSCGHDS